MGYRSNVYIALQKKGFEKLIETINDITDKELKEQVRKLLIDGSCYLISTKIDKMGNVAPIDHIVLEWDDTKWYYEPEVIGFSAIVWLMNFIKSNQVQYHYIELGEDINDTEDVVYVTDDDELYTLIGVRRDVNVAGIHMGHRDNILKYIENDVNKEGEKNNGK